MTSAVHAITASVGGRVLLFGCTDGLKAYRVFSKGFVKKLLGGSSSSSSSTTTSDCHAVGGSVRLVAVFGETPLVAFVLDGSVTPAAVADGDAEAAAACEKPTSFAVVTSRVLRLYDVSQGQTIAELLFQTAVVGVQMNSKRLAVALAECIHVFDLWTLQHLAELRTTSPLNTNGLLALSDLTRNSRGHAVSFLVFPQSDRECGDGDVWVVQVTEEQMDHSGQGTSVGDLAGGNRDGQIERVNTVRAHRCAVVCLAMTRDGTRLATASTRGTTVKVFEPSTARLLYQFRRGLTTARMLSLSFDSSSESSEVRLAALSNRGTLHVFRCSSLGADELVETTPRAPFPGLLERSFAQAKVKEVPAALHASPSLGFDSLGENRVHCCFFSDNGKFLWIVLPALVNEKTNDATARGESGGDSSSGDRKGTDESVCWILFQYAVHMHGCELVRSEVLM